MSHHDTTVPLSVIDPDDETGTEMEVSFDWTPSSATEEFYIVSWDNPKRPKPIVKLDDEEKIIAWLEENWDRPDRAAEEADHLYEEYRERQMEGRHRG